MTLICLHMVGKVVVFGVALSFIHNPFVHKEYIMKRAPNRPAKERPASRRPPVAQPPAEANGKKIFVLDTNVLMHDPTSLYRFEEHDVFIPMTTLEELDNHKKGQTEVSRNVRQVCRMMDELLADCQNIDEGVSLTKPSKGLATGRLFLQTEAVTSALPATMPGNKGDNQIIAVVMHLQRKHPKQSVILVSKDINMRIKTRAVGLPAEDYFSDKVLEDTDLLPTGTRVLPPDFWEKHGQQMESGKHEGRTYWKVKGPQCSSMLVNEFVTIENDADKHMIVKEVAGKSATLETIVDYAQPRNAVWGITARNPEQNYALNLLMDPNIDFVTLIGQAGTGKTLLTLAAALTQTLEKKVYAEIIMTRVTVPVGEDIGFLPGSEEDKMAPWMGALEDNLDVLCHTDEDDSKPYGGDWGKAATNDIVRSKIKVKSINFMRGRTFLKKFLIIDEAQNLTPKQMKTMITRAGPGTKVVCLGNIAQIDTPYLTEGSSGLTYVVDRFKGWEHSGHVTLQRGERSRLADHAAEVL